jgi:malyl-CoA/(S)-citramalyl-CoA lyase
MAIGAPTPPIDIPMRPSRMIHFFDPSNPRMAEKVPQLTDKLDVLLANLEDAIRADKKIEAREGLVEIAQATDFGDSQFWVRMNSLDSPWALDDLLRIVPAVGAKIDVIMVPKVEGPWDIHYVDQLLAQLEAKAGLERAILIHAILETAQGVANVEEICMASPRMQGISLGPADLAASRRMKTTRIGGGHPAYLVRSDPDPEDENAPRAIAQQDLWHYTIARMVDACSATGIYAYYGPFGDIGDSQGCEDQFRNAFLMGCVGAWSLHPKQIEIARRVFSPPPDEVSWAKRVIEAMGDGTGAVMLDGKMQDDASVKQCKVMVAYAKMIAERDSEYAELYGF